MPGENYAGFPQSIPWIYKALSTGFLPDSEPDLRRKDEYSAGQVATASLVFIRALSKNEDAG